MKVYYMLATWLWWAIMVMPTQGYPSNVEEKQKLGFTTITYHIGYDANYYQYSAFIEKIRNALKGNTTTCNNIPLTREPPAPDSERFLLIELQMLSSVRVTLAVDVLDGNLVAYADKYQGQERAHFYDEAPDIAKTLLFQGAILEPIPFARSYEALENRLKTTRKNIYLGFLYLQDYVYGVYGLEYEEGRSDWTIAQFLIVTTQMVLDAARFKYIENLVVEALKKGGQYEVFYPDDLAISYEDNWENLSKAIQRAETDVAFLKYYERAGGENLKGSL